MVTDGPEIILRGLIEGLRGIKRGSGYEHTFQVTRGRMNLQTFSGSEDEDLFVEMSPDVHETRTNQAGPLAECTCGVEIWVAIQDHARGPAGAERDTSEVLNGAIRDVLRRIYARDWDAPTWSEGRGTVKGCSFPAIERHLDPGVSLKLARIQCEVLFQDSNDFD